MILSLLFGLGISTASMFTSDFSDVSHIVYGRYLDNFMGPFYSYWVMRIEKWKARIEKNNFLCEQSFDFGTCSFFDVGNISSAVGFRY